MEVTTVPDYECSKCGSHDFVIGFQTTSKAHHIKMNCAHCKKHQMYLPMTPDNIRLARENETVTITNKDRRQKQPARETADIFE